jgi:hypothetical protein
MIAENTSLRAASVLTAREVNIAPQIAKVGLHAINANASITLPYAINAITSLWQPLVTKTDRYAVLSLL